LPIPIKLKIRKDLVIMATIRKRGNTYGKPMNPHTAGYWLRDFCKENNFRFCDTHSFRHLNASLLINAGIDVTSVSAALGHAHTSTTLNIYSHYFSEYQARTSEVIVNAINFKHTAKFKI